MKVSSIKMRGVLSHKHSEVDLPDKGIVLVQGPNGAGKSSIIEAVSLAIYGKLLRGSSGWTPGEKHASCVVTADGWVVDRRNFGAERLLLTGSPGSVESPTFETKSKTQAAVLSLFGEHDVWRRTHVFSSSDASNFTRATDKERKQLLEALLGLNLFDEAAAIASEDLAKATKAFAAAEKARDKADSDYEYATRHVDELKRSLATMQTELLPVGRANDLILKEIEDLEEVWNHKMAQLKELETIAQKADWDLKALHKLDEDAWCPTCGQELPDHKGHVSNKRLEEAEATKKAAAKCVEAFKNTLQGDPVLEQVKALRKESEQVVSAEAHNGSISRMVSSQRDALNQALNTADGAAATVVDTHAALQVAKRYLDLTTSVAKVTGPKGLRSQVLGRAIAGIEARANHYISQLAEPGVRLKLSPTTENKTGGQRDDISLEITGFAAGDGYRGASAGERRRVDVALLFALADIAAAAHGTAPGTLFVDEAFDALDVDGTAAVVALLQRIAETRCVLVITHSEDLAQRIRPVKALRITKGVVH